MNLGLAPRIQHEEFRLNEPQFRVGKWVGEQRNDHALKHGWVGHGASCGKLGPEYNIMGACAELAVSYLLNLSWDYHIGKHDQPDVGGMVEVRSRSNPESELHTNIGSTHPWVLVIVIDPYTFRALGWIGPEAAKTFEVRQYPNSKKSYHWVPQAALRPLWELRRICHARQANAA